ncbi:transcriptional repressor LexA [Haliangium ochraceum]|uniref:LexA repressor n=1 Tax=Haliangium ochraceum (strain DSM 14365 / JCM 11303 / SMP-2) TaxID=502025 RepID=D0LJD5_HALO1|nr:transcriptional repressor LexA [Haliangium ochraceum]ACY14982.1 transcriptional repressor, LexA family [Haliangium ochraceum DSM 14365]
MPDALTSRQREILDFITDFIQERGYPPTLREIGEHFGIRSTNGVNDHLKALEKKGYLRREDLKSRAMWPVQVPPEHETENRGKVIPLRKNVEEDAVVDIPILGRVAAGLPILAVENVEDRVRVDRFFLGTPPQQLFGLRVVGESMIEDGILDGDYVFVKKTPTAQPGDIVVAMIEEEATVKRYYPERDSIRFEPANSNMRPIVVKKSDFRAVDLLGVVVGVYRKLR